MFKKQSMWVFTGLFITMVCLSGGLSTNAAPTISAADEEMELVGSPTEHDGGLIFTGVLSVSEAYALIMQDVSDQEIRLANDARNVQFADEETETVGGAAEHYGGLGFAGVTSVSEAYALVAQNASDQANLLAEAAIAVEEAEIAGGGAEGYGGAGFAGVASLSEAYALVMQNASDQEVLLADSERNVQFADEETELVGGLAQHNHSLGFFGAASVSEVYALVMQNASQQEKLLAAATLAAEEAEIAGGAAEGYGGGGFAGVASLSEAYILVMQNVSDQEIRLAKAATPLKIGDEETERHQPWLGTEIDISYSSSADYQTRNQQLAECTLRCRVIGKLLKLNTNTVDEEERPYIGFLARPGEALFENGEIATYETFNVWDLKKGEGGMNQGYTSFTFKDGSKIYTSINARMEANTTDGGKWDTKNIMGKILKGTGRFAGISGDVSGIGSQFIPEPGKTDENYSGEWTLTYTLSAK